MNSSHMKQKMLLLTGVLSSGIVDSVWDVLKVLSHSVPVSATSSFSVSLVSVPAASDW